MRAFVVGNGPTLTRTDLNKMIGEVSFACNNIHLIYPYTKWRPSHYVRAEEATTLGPEDWQDSMNAHLELGCEIWCNEMFVHGDGSKANIIHGCAHYGRNFDSEYCPMVWHLPRICTFGSSVNAAVQIAAMKGYDPIYLVGCDLGYKDGGSSHFHPNYEHGKEQPARLANMNTLIAHVIAARSCPVPIYNATLGGELEVFERVDYESLFNR